MHCMLTRNSLSKLSQMRESDKDQRKQLPAYVKCLASPDTSRKMLTVPLFKAFSHFGKLVGSVACCMPHMLAPSLCMPHFNDLASYRCCRNPVQHFCAQFHPPSLSSLHPPPPIHKIVGSTLVSGTANFCAFMPT